MFNFFKNKQHKPEENDAFGQPTLQDSLTKRDLLGENTQRTEWSFIQKPREKDMLDNSPLSKPGKSESCGALDPDRKRLLTIIENLEQQNKQYQQNLEAQRFDYEKAMSKLKKYKEDKKKLTEKIKTLQHQNTTLLIALKDRDIALQQQQTAKDEGIQKPASPVENHDEQTLEVEAIPGSDLKVPQNNLKKLQADLQDVWGYLFEFSKGDTLSIDSKPSRADEILDPTIQQFTSHLLHECSKADLMNLDALEINLWECPLLTNQGIIYLGSLLSKKLQNLQRLELRFSGCSQITDDGIQGLGQHICKNLPALNHLALSFRGCPNLSDVGAKNLGVHISVNLRALQTLEFTFDDCSLISDEGVTSLSPYFAKFAKTLQKLSLSFSSCAEISDSGLVYFAASLSKTLKALQDLSLDFSSCNKLTNDGLHALTSSLSRNLRNLKSLNLNFNECPLISDLESLTFKNLSQLTLKFDKSQIGDRPIRNLAVSLGKTFLSLNRLELQFNDCEKLSDEGVNDIGVYLSNHLKDLKSLILRFNNTQVYGKGVNGIGAYLGINLKNLERLELSFNHTKISDAGLAALGVSISQNFKKLHHLKLNLRSCSNISDKGLNEFGTFICSNLQSLPSLSLDTRWCPKISDEGSDTFKRSIRTNLHNLQHFKFDWLKY